MLTFVASRITSGNTLFPDKITIDTGNVTYYKGHLTGYQSTTISRKNIASVYMDKGIFFGEINIETIGGKHIKASGFNNSDAKAIVAYLSLNNQSESNINQNLYVNTTSSKNEQIEENIQTIPDTVSIEKKILDLAAKNPILTIKDIIFNLDVELDKAEIILENFVMKGIAQKDIDEFEKTKYMFSFDNKQDYQLINKIINNYNINNEKYEYHIGIIFDNYIQITGISHESFHIKIKNIEKMIINDEYDFNDTNKDFFKKLKILNEHCYKKQKVLFDQTWESRKEKEMEYLRMFSEQINNCEIIIERHNQRLNYNKILLKNVIVEDEDSLKLKLMKTCFSISEGKKSIISFGHISSKIFENKENIMSILKTLANEGYIEICTAGGEKIKYSVYDIKNFIITDKLKNYINNLL
jgi:hypothetical protein